MGGGLTEIWLGEISRQSRGQSAMNRVISVNDGTLLYGLLAEMAGDIIVRTDTKGYVQHASPGLEPLGVNLSEMLIAPHLGDLATGEQRSAICAYIEDALTGITATEHVQFSGPVLEQADVEAGREGQWYSLTLRPSPNEHGQVSGLVGVLREIEPSHVRDQQLMDAAMTDSLTGLPNRRAFMSAASYLLERGPGGALAVLEIDDFRAVGLRFGQAATDEVVMAFAQFLSVMLQPGHSAARLEGGRFAILLPDAQQHSAFSLIDEIISTFARVTTGSSGSAGVVKASAGVATIAGSLDSILAKAERGLVLARVSGGGRAELGGESPSYLASSTRAKRSGLATEPNHWLAHKGYRA